MSVVALPTSVSVAFGSEIVLSAVGSTTVRVVSWSSAVAPSNTMSFEPIVRSAPRLMVAVLIVGDVNVLFNNVCVASSKAIFAVLDKSVDAIVMFAVPSKDWPAIVLAVSNAVAVSALPVRSPVILPSTFATNVPVVIVRLPVEAPVNVPVPTINLSVDSSNPIKAFALSPLSITIPISLPGVPVVPVPNSINLSVIVELVVLSVVVVPLTVRLPVTVALPPIATAPLNVAAPASDISKLNAVIVEPPSSPIILKSLSWLSILNSKSFELFLKSAIEAEPSANTILPPSAFKNISPTTSKTKSVESFVILPNSVLASLNIISAPSASNIISPPASTLKSPLASICILPSNALKLKLPDVLTIASTSGPVKVLFVNVSVPVNVAKSSSDNAVLN